MGVHLFGSYPALAGMNRTGSVPVLCSMYPLCNADDDDEEKEVMVLARGCVREREGESSCDNGRQTAVRVLVVSQMVTSHRPWEGRGDE